MSNWFIKNNGIDFEKISKELNISPIVGKLLANRKIENIEEANTFLYGDIEKMHKASLMNDLVKAATILEEDIAKEKKILVVGDYDVDGIMSTYVLVSGLEELGAEVTYRIPDRINEGYGINNKIIDEAKRNGISTIVTCDNGISALEEIEYAKSLGINIIITDHHELPYTEENGEKIILYPDAGAIVNPKSPKCSYPFDKLCGAGVAYKLVEYLSLETFKRDRHEVNKLLEYVAIATIADVVELKDENRIIVQEGLELLNQTKNLGLKALIEAMEIEGEIGVYHIGFIIGPALNAAGRLDTASKGVELLLSQDEVYCNQVAKELRSLNDYRKKLTEDSIERAIKQIEETDLINNNILVVYDEEAHESVAGIVAGRVKDRYYKPSIVLTDSGNGELKGSGRSISEYNMFEKLMECKDLLGRFGGHPMAAGMSLDKEDLEDFRMEINQKADLTKEDLTKKYYIDLGLPIDYLSYDLINDLKDLAPHGIGNPKPIFGDKDLKINKLYRIGRNKDIFKMELLSDKGAYIEAIMFNDTEEFENLIVEKYGRDKFENLLSAANDDIIIDIIYSPSINEFRGRTNLQLIIENFRI